MTTANQPELTACSIVTRIETRIYGHGEEGGGNLVADLLLGRPQFQSRRVIARYYWQRPSTLFKLIETCFSIYIWWILINTADLFFIDKITQWWLGYLLIDLSNSVIQLNLVLTRRFGFKYFNVRPKPLFLVLTETENEYSVFFFNFGRNQNRNFWRSFTKTIMI